MTQGLRPRPRTQKNSRPRTALLSIDLLEAKGRNARGQGPKDTGASVLQKLFFFRRSPKKQIFKKFLLVLELRSRGLLCSSQSRWSDMVGHWSWYALDWRYGPKSTKYCCKLRFGKKSYSLAVRKPKLYCSTHKRNPDLVSLSMNGSKLELSKEARLLGATLDSKLTWKPHITRITR